VIALGTEHDYLALLSMSISIGFQGSGILTDSDKVTTLSISYDKETISLIFQR
jgi:hypothetical protein